MLRRKNIQIRDPFILTDNTEKLYYMYGTTMTDGFDVYFSADLDHWGAAVSIRVMGLPKRS